MKHAPGTTHATKHLHDNASHSSSQNAEAFLAAIVESSDDPIISKSLEGIIITWNKAAERVFGYGAYEAIGRPVTMLIPDDRLEEEPAILARINAGERVDHFETVRRRKDGTLIDISLTISPIRNSDGTIIGASKIARDITERRRAEQRQELLFREMHHRVKNLFALTSGLIKLASRFAETPAELAASMTERLVALSRAHELTLPVFAGAKSVEEPPASLFQLLDGILAPFQDDRRARWQFSGQNPTLSQGIVTNLALLLHEFTTNAAKYGSLSTMNGDLLIHIETDTDMLRLTWKERNGPDAPATEPGPSGFGSQLERAMSHSLQAAVKREWASDGLMITLEVPLTILQNRP